MTFEDREHAFEAHFAFEQELDFKAQQRRNRLLALWAGAKMDLTGEALEDYVLSVVRADLRHVGPDEVYAKVLTDLSEKGASVAPRDLRQKMVELAAIARHDVHEGA
jgi:hypothetical protein